LDALREESGWLGDHGEDSVTSDVPLIAEFAMYPGDKAAASWLPSEGLAKLWRGFITERPLELGSPAKGARVANNQALSLTLNGVPSGAARVDFFDQEDVLVPDVAVSGGKASAMWDPTWGGVRGVAAVALDAMDGVLRVGRPVHVVVQGKAAPMGATQEPPVERDAGVAANGGSGGMGGALGMAGRSAAGGGGMRGPLAGAGGRRGLLDAGAADAALGENVVEAGTEFRDVPALRGSCACSVGPRSAGRVAGPLACVSLLLLSCVARFRRRSLRRVSSEKVAG
ncbi:MAG TPA: hypothetical protein VFN67_21910, partial [Polyangiales bacterium]|nr:hypothetical protein [Polyangiales bacterium]